MNRAIDSSDRCRVYWGTHGCKLKRGHEGGHLCECTFDTLGRLIPHGKGGNVGRAPYYGPNTVFYGEDA